MKQILSNTSALCWYGGVPSHFFRINKIKSGSLILGTNDGSLYVYDSYSDSLKKIYHFPSQESILQIKVDRFYVAVLLEDGSVYRFYNYEGTKDCRINDRGYPLKSSLYKKMKPFSDGPKLFADNVDHIFSPYAMLMDDSTVFGRCFKADDTIKKVRDLEYFSGDKIFDLYGSCLAISNMSASVYTLDMNDCTTWKMDTFSFEGEFMSNVAKVMQDSINNSDDNETAAVKIGYIEELEDEMVKQEEIMNSMLPKSMVRVVHHKYAYLDFVKLYGSEDPYNPFVVTGGSDLRIIITDFISHKVFFNEKLDDIPRCCCVSEDKVYVGCDNGTIVIINKSDYNYEIISVGEKDFKCIETNWRGKYVVAVNYDDMVFCIDNEKMELGGEFIEEGVKDVVVGGDHAYVLTESGDLFKFQMEA